MKSFQSSFRNLNFSPSTSILLKLFFPFTDITCFPLFKTSVLSNNRFAKLFKAAFFSKATMVMRFPAKKNAGCPKAPRDLPPRQKKHSPHPVGLSCDSSPPPPASVRAYTDVTTKISRMDRFSNFLSYGASRAPLRMRQVGKNV